MSQNAIECFVEVRAIIVHDMLLVRVLRSKIFCVRGSGVSAKGPPERAFAPWPLQDVICIVGRKFGRAER